MVEQPQRLVDDQIVIGIQQHIDASLEQYRVKVAWQVPLVFKILLEPRVDQHHHAVHRLMVVDIRLLEQNVHHGVQELIVV